MHFFSVSDPQQRVTRHQSRNPQNIDIKERSFTDGTYAITKFSHVHLFQELLSFVYLDLNFICFLFLTFLIIFRASIISFLWAFVIMLRFLLNVSLSHINYEANFIIYLLQVLVYAKTSWATALWQYKPVCVIMPTTQNIAVGLAIDKTFLLSGNL